MFRRSALTAVSIAATIGLLAGCSAETPGTTDPIDVEDPALAQLIEDAQAEGSLTFYTVPPEDVAQALVDRFSEKYGIDAQFVRLTTGALIQRYSSEVEAGAPGADVVLISNSGFTSQARDKDWLLAPADAELPGFPGDIPENALLDDGNVVIQYAPSGIGYNTDLVKTAPKSWEDLLDPAYEGKILVPNPSSSPVAVEFWYMLMEKYGEDYLEDMAGQIGRFVEGTIPAVESLGAGEGAITLPATGSGIVPAAEKGAPLKIVYPDFTTGPEIVPLISAKAASPNAARLFTLFVMSEEGTEIINVSPGTVSPYVETLPAEWTRVDAAKAAAAKDKIAKLLGAE